MAAAAGLAGAIERELRGRGNAARAEGARRYLKSDLEFIGLTAAELRACVRDAVAAHGDVGAGDLRTAVVALWRRPVFELRAAAVELLDRYGGSPETGDAALLERMLREAGTWALVDWLATRVVGRLVEDRPELGAVLDRWAADEEFWLRRAAMLALLPALRRGGGDFDRFGRYADGLLEDREFFIRKAIGWVLREVGKKRPELVEEWLRPRLARASGLTVREAVKHLPATRRAALLAARPTGPRALAGASRTRRERARRAR